METGFDSTALIVSEGLSSNDTVLTTSGNTESTGAALTSETKVLSGPSEVDYDSPYAQMGEVAYALDVQAENGTEEDRLGRKVCLSDLEEAIIITFRQAGKDTTAILRIYYDYQPVGFRVAGSEEYADSYVFDVADGKGLEIPVYLSPSIVPDGSTHKLMVAVVVGYGEHAADTTSDVELMNYGAEGLFDLSFTEDADGVPQSLYSMTVADVYYDYFSDSLTLTQNVEGVADGIFYEPDRVYTAEAAGNCTFQYIITAFDETVASALLLVTVDHEPVLINGQEYMWVDMEDRMAQGEVTFDCTVDPGQYDVIAYVIFEPFDSVAGNLCDIPQTCTRLTLEVQKK